jgi:plasmid stabilization system protein ParE
MAIVKWLPGALKDLKRLHEFIGQHSPVAASRAIDSLIESAESLTEFPEIGRPWELELDYRELFVKYGARGYVIAYFYNCGHRLLRSVDTCTTPSIGSLILA